MNFAKNGYYYLWNDYLNPQKNVSKLLVKIFNAEIHTFWGHCYYDENANSIGSQLCSDGQATRLGCLGHPPPPQDGGFHHEAEGEEQTTIHKLKTVWNGPLATL